MRFKRSFVLQAAFLAALLSTVCLAQTESEYFSRGEAAYDRKDYDTAIAQYSNVLSLRPYYPEALNNRGLAYYMKKSYDFAISDFNRAIQLKPSLATAYMNRGL